MKPIILDAKQRQEIERQRHATDRKRVYARLSAVLWVADGRSRFEVADLLGCSIRQLSDWLRVYRNRGLEALVTLNYRGDVGELTAGQVRRLQEEIGTGRFRTARQVRQWVEENLHVGYSLSGIKGLLHRIGASFHRVTGFLWKADPQEQRRFVQKYERHRRLVRRVPGGQVRRYFIDACHPVWGLELKYCCWLLLGQRLHVGVGDGRHRLNILGAYCPEDQEYVDLRLTRDHINGEQFVNLLRLLRDLHPEVKRFLLYLDHAAYYRKPIVRAWLSRHPEFRLVWLPTYSPNLNLIERLWRYLRQQALSRWHWTFAAMQAAVAALLDHLSDHAAALKTLMNEAFAIVDPARLEAPDAVAACG